MKISVIIPVLNEEVAIREKLPPLQALRNEGHEIIVVDGGSTDSSLQLAKEGSDFLISSARGRARQMNAGARIANGDLLLFLHIDTQLPDNCSELLSQCADKSRDAWGRFNVHLSGKHFMFRIIESMMNWRSRLTGIATGDQAIFVSRALFEQVEGFADIPLMEDIELCTRLRKINQPICLPATVMTSSRKWETRGIIKTMLLMWKLRFSYWLGKDPEQLVQQYYP